MALALVRSVLSSSTGMVEDRVINTMVIEYNQLVDAAVLADAWERFWGRGAGVGQGQLVDYLSNDIVLDAEAPDGPRLEIADLNVATGEVSPVVATIPFALDFATVPISTPLPREAAICVSFRSDGLPAARNRGRMFIGPLNAEAVDNQLGTARVAAGAVSGATEGLKRFCLRLLAIDAHLCVWSRTAASVSRVTQGWCDNEFDTQRRRGLRATQRTTVALP